MDDEERRVVAAMKKYGGSFVVALAEAFERADMQNFAKLRATFPEYWGQYEKMAGYDNGGTPA